MATRRLTGTATAASEPDNGGDNSGGGGGSAGGYVDDVFSTYVYEGTGADQTIENGIDLDGEGGLVWLKQRSGDRQPAIFDTERGEYILYTDHTQPQSNGYVSSFGAFTFNSSGFSTGSAPVMNEDGEDYVSWTFRKAPSFFDVVTFVSGTDSNREIPHNLGVSPGMVIVKSTDTDEIWLVYHKDTGNNEYLTLNEKYASYAGPQFWGSTDTNFIINEPNILTPGQEYVAYLFAHDDSDESMIKCGSYTGSNGAGQEIDLGWEPQFILIKNASRDPSGYGTDWVMRDNIRGINDKQLAYLYANDAAAEVNASVDDSGIALTPTGFKTTTNPTSHTDYESDQYIYMAIRRPNKPAEEFEPEELFVFDAGVSDVAPAYRTPFVADMGIATKVGESWDNWIASRLTSGTSLKTNETEAETVSSAYTWDYVDGWCKFLMEDVTHWSWRRAHGFFDVVIPNNKSYKPESNKHHHSLGVPPELIIAKCRDYDQQWYVGIQGDLAGDSYYQLALDTDALAETTAATFKWGGHTKDVFYSSLFGTSAGYIHYLFASAPGISKVGSYTGTGIDVEVDCGFAGGARWVLIKRTDASGDWLIVTLTSALNFMIPLNKNYQMLGVYGLTPTANGFKANAGQALTNTPAAEYIFYAIA